MERQDEEAWAGGLVVHNTASLPDENSDGQSNITMENPHCHSMLELETSKEFLSSDESSNPNTSKEFLDSCTEIEDVGNFKSLPPSPEPPSPEPHNLPDEARSGLDHNHNSDEEDDPAETFQSMEKELERCQSELVAAKERIKQLEAATR